MHAGEPASANNLAHTGIGGAARYLTSRLPRRTLHGCMPSTYNQ
jgi:hypothetical protein